jgi:hypothetical protein
VVCLLQRQRFRFDCCGQWDGHCGAGEESDLSPTEAKRKRVGVGAGTGPASRDPVWVCGTGGQLSSSRYRDHTLRFSYASFHSLRRIVIRGSTVWTIVFDRANVPQASGLWPPGIL